MAACPNPLVCVVSFFAGYTTPVNVGNMGGVSISQTVTGVEVDILPAGNNGRPLAAF
jgi:hypothetical protein